jgi:hypothetical protein
MLQQRLCSCRHRQRNRDVVAAGSAAARLLLPPLLPSVFIWRQALVRGE